MKFQASRLSKWTEIPLGHIVEGIALKNPAGGQWYAFIGIKIKRNTIAVNEFKDAIGSAWKPAYDMHLEMLTGRANRFDFIDHGMIEEEESGPTQAL